MTNESRREVLKRIASLLAVSAGAYLPGCAHRGEREGPAQAGAAHDGGAGWADGAWRRAASIVGRIREAEFPDRNFLVTEFGAVAGDGDARLGIQAAIDACGKLGGGRVVLPAGRWRSDGPLHLRSRTELHVSEGAHLVFSGNRERYTPLVLTRWEGTEVWTWSPMIFGDGLDNVAITGAGTIDGDGEKNFLPWRRKQKPDQNALRQMGHDGVPVNERVFGEGHWLRPHFIQFRDCRNVLIDGPTLVDSPFWVTHLLYCDQAIVRNLNVVSRHVNSDGVDVDSSSNVLIERCRFDVGDDGVAIKSGRDQDGWRVNRPSKNVVVRDCEYLGHAGGGLAIGSEMSGGVEDVFIEDYRMEKVHHALYFKSNLDRGGRIERVSIRNIDVGSADVVAIFTNDYHSYRGGNFPTRFENVAIENVECARAGVGLSIIGRPEAPVRNVSVRNFAVADADTPLQIRHVERLRFDNVSINGELMRAVSETSPASFDTALVP